MLAKINPEVLEFGHELALPMPEGIQVPSFRLQMKSLIMSTAPAIDLETLLPHLANKLPSQLLRSLGKVLKICTHCTYTALSPQILTFLDLESFWFHHTRVGMR